MRTTWTRTVEDMDYMATALTLAGARADHSEAAVARLDALAARHGRALPQSVRHWYSLADATAILEPERRADHVYPVDDLGQPEAYYWPTDDEGWPEGLEEQEEREFDPMAHGLLPFLQENQGVYCLAVQLDGSEDPPVLLSWDGVQPGTWTAHADTFSQWVYTRVWDFALHRGASMLEATAERVTAAELEALEQVLEVRPATRSDREEQRRFAGPRDEQRLLLLSPWGGTGGWSVYLWASTAELLVELVHTVRPVLALGEVHAGSHEPSDTVKRAMERLRA
ncbi:hypothetical protein F8144_39675 [Streptomyces triticiradicis]|uniref:Knr4/Smi1-like domain-containing protein n=2 Tax=Streptomyces triticiradicis TaxID=2651189 RepID=A0A7J5D5L4_9ACTN|nr:hypothetical protein F8144_39675 [Streptomyces triticiradicis]